MQVNTLVAESILAGFTRRKVRQQFSEDAMNGALTDLIIFGLVAGVVDRRTVGDGQAGPVTGRVVSVGSAR